MIRCGTCLMGHTRTYLIGHVFEGILDRGIRGKLDK